ncbi:hypothetical protein [Aureimonas mangrovi]|uniref:hypothetical protein n=1 Tax=Aureimonas mangrovi TaxID=2758041 RepID=UPI00163D5991|nr:hypothetical protein [Aureimonas mangrovi]
MAQAAGIRDEAGHARDRKRVLWPLLILALVLILCVLLLSIPLKLPVGAMYWDLVVYLDGGQRVLTGQQPSVDFFAPVGPLAYWLFAAGMALFERAQPLLLVQWSLLAVSAPALALLVFDIGRRSRSIAFALLLPFLAFQLMPMNVEQYSTFPSVDGYGIYNRHGAELLYLLVASLLFTRSRVILAVLIAWLCLALFLVKITGFLAGGLVCAFAFAAGRVGWKAAIGAALGFLAALAVLQLLTGTPSAYLQDIATLITMNEGGLLSRFLQAASLHFGVFGSASLLLLALLFAERREIGLILGAKRRAPLVKVITRLLDRPSLWLGVTLFAGLFYETQNTGGQAFILLWPVLLAILQVSRRPAPRLRAVILILVAATALPPLVDTLHRFSRAMIGQAYGYVALDHTHLKALGQVSQRPEAMERARLSREVYIEHADAFQAFADRNILPGLSLYSDLDFQLGWLMAADEAADAILAYERENGVRFETILSLNFVNPFPYILDRQGPRYVAIGADPYRTVPQPPDERTMAEVSASDLILYPACPITSANEALRDIYAPALEGRREIRLSACWLAYPRG